MVWTHMGVLLYFNLLHTTHYTFGGTMGLASPERRC